ncbi:hypothetical protein C8R46DRAFT_370050 [Mycena filopes]|nr:hypothetical protein C8R46DRAFT_370050 [Mycena filopes]
MSKFERYMTKCTDKRSSTGNPQDSEQYGTPIHLGKSSAKHQHPPLVSALALAPGSTPSAHTHASAKHVALRLADAPHHPARRLGYSAGRMGRNRRVRATTRTRGNGEQEHAASDEKRRTRIRPRRWKVSSICISVASDAPTPRRHRRSGSCSTTGSRGRPSKKHVQPAVSQSCLVETHEPRPLCASIYQDKHSTPLISLRPHGRRQARELVSAWGLARRRR